jgi:hypothetical protein
MPDHKSALIVQQLGALFNVAPFARDRRRPRRTCRRVGGGAPRAGLAGDERTGFWELRCTEFDAKPFFDGAVEPCINGGALALGAYFGHPSESLSRRLFDEQLDDGDRNSEAPKSARLSFHTTVCVLEGLPEYQRAVGSAPEIAAARQRGEENLLERGLFRQRSPARSQVRRCCS